VVNADSPQAPMLNDIMCDLEGYVTYLYPGCILTDIFLMLDDVHDLSMATHRGEIIDMLTKMRSDTCMLYMISNLNSHKLYEPNAHFNMMHSIALSGIMKDYISMQSKEQIYRWYNERYFQEDCYRTGGHFMTLGYLSISRPLKLIKKLMLIELLTYRENQFKPGHTFVWEAQRVPDKNKIWLKENIYGLCMDASINLDGLRNYTNEKALNVLFGERLEHFYDSNFKTGHSSNGDFQIRKYLRETAYEPSKGFYYVHALTSPDGDLRKYLVGLLEEAQSEIISIDTETDNWRNERCKPPKQLFRNPNRIPDFVYELAVRYLEPRFLRLQPELEIMRLKEAIEYVDKCYREFDNNRKKVDEYILRCKEEAKRLRESDEVFADSGNLHTYYIARLREFIENDTKFNAIYTGLWRSLENDALDLYAAELEGYIENTVMRGDGFDRGIVEDITGAWGVVGGKVYESIWRYIIKNRHFNIMLKSGCKNLYSEINVFMDASSQLARWAGTKEKINFFYKENADRIDVLYHGGAFAAGDLYYEALYRGRGL